MSNKIGRNDTCHCGSGKKYKKCCMNSDKESELPLAKPNKIENKSFEFIESYNSQQLLNFIIGLQLHPNNHGKNLRVEKLATHIILNLNNNTNGDLKLFKISLDNEFAYEPMEDLPENLFSENIVFFGGNYTVFAGISGYAVEIFKNFTETIFTQENGLPNEFKNHVYSGVILILELGKILSSKFNNEGYIKGAQGKRKFDYSFNAIDTSFCQEEIIQICKKHQIDPRIINDFIAQPNDTGFSNNDPNKNPLLTKPIINFEDKYYFILITSQVTALNEFIIRLSKKYDCNQKLTVLYHDKLWHEQWLACDKMGWQLTDIKLPTNNTSTILKERVFQIEQNRLAYSCYVHNDTDEEYFSDKKLNIEKRITEVITELKKNPSMKDHKFLSLVTYDCMGRNMIIGFGDPQKDELRLSFSMHQFNFLCSSEKWGNLSLWKFAKSYEIFYRTTQTALIDTLDIYFIYKSQNQSFYFGDEARPNYLPVVPGLGSNLIKVSKIEKNNHGILYQIDRLNVFIPSTKYADFAPLYKPLYSLGYFAICLKAFNFPIWLVNHQVKDQSITGHLRNFSEAIAFWLFKLKNEIAKFLNPVISNYFEIDIVLEEKFFENTKTKDFLEINEIGNYSFSLNTNILSFLIPFSKIKTFAGSNNFGEREMMKAILNAFNLVVGINFSEQDIERFINRLVAN